MVRSRYILLLIIAVILYATGCSFYESSQKPSFSISKKIATHSSYTVFSQTKSYVDFTLTRPASDDQSTLLSVAGTYTSPLNTVEGYVVWNGKIIQNKERQGWNGAVIFYNGEVEIAKTNGGKLLTRKEVQEIADAGGSLIQAHLLVYGGVAEHFKPQLPSIRRALAHIEMPPSAPVEPDALYIPDTTPVIIESQKALDLNEFAQDLVELGVRYAVNLDMGSWSEGWYRDPYTNGAVVIGFPNETTSRQTNWIIFKRIEETKRPPPSIATPPESPRQ